MLTRCRRKTRKRYRSTLNKYLNESKQKGAFFSACLTARLAGICMLARWGGDMKCHQVCIQYDARRRLYGAAIVQVMEHYAWEGLSASITLRCGFDLDANDFWKSMGYQVIAHQEGGVRRMRTINVWRKQMSAAHFQTLAIDAAVGVVDASVWRKNKHTGLVTQFVRGQNMRDYRAKLTAPKITDLFGIPYES